MQKFNFYLDQVVKLEKLEEMALKLEFAKIRIDLKICFFQTADRKGRFPLISKRKKFLRNGKYCILTGFTKKVRDKC